jgi:hypothetical protein
MATSARKPTLWHSIYHVSIHALQTAPESVWLWQSGAAAFRARSLLPCALRLRRQVRLCVMERHHFCIIN